jgi:hypothetical protein
MSRSAPAAYFQQLIYIPCVTTQAYWQQDVPFDELALKPGVFYSLCYYYSASMGYILAGIIYRLSQ